MKSKLALSITFASLSLAAMTGCGPVNSQMGDSRTNATNDTARQAGLAMNGEQTVQVTNLTYDAATQTATLHVVPKPAGSTSTNSRQPYRSVVPSHPRDTAAWQGAASPAGHGASTSTGMASAYTGEQALDITSHDGIVNYATANLPGRNVRWVRVVFADMNQTKQSRPTPSTSPSAARGPHHASFMVSVLNVTASTPNRNTDHNLFSAPLTGNDAAGFAGGAAGFAGRATGLPPGVHMDPSISPIAGRGASATAKANAVIREARRKLGTPYIWGHNEDRGQYGFDCSNFTAYVYHHALGYRISALSVVQGHSVGYWVSRNQMRVGDLLIFEYGKHVGIYAGNGQMIDCGGGKGKVSYMTIARGSYWGNHLTAVKRMF